jgi:hypothetical protein
MVFLRPLTFMLFILAVALGTARAEAPKDAELNKATYPTWRDHVLPRAWELNFQRIAWRPSFWQAVIEAQQKDMPILLWTMNGHPLCNT